MNGFLFLVLIIGAYYAIGAVLKQKQRTVQLRGTNLRFATKPRAPFQIYRLLYVLPLVGFVIGFGWLQDGLAIANDRPDREPQYPLSDLVLRDSSTTATGDFSRMADDVSLQINYDFADLAEQMSQREQINQVLDWLLYAIVNDADLSVDELNRILFDLAPVRYGYLESVSNLQYGAWRMAYLGDGRAVALVPDDDLEKNAILIADEIRKNTGNFPSILHVFGYVVDLPNLQATIGRHNDLNGEYFTSRESGYVEAVISNYAGLVDFMEHSKRVTSVRANGNTLVVTGRNLPDDTYLNITAEDVANLWQSQAIIDQKLADFYAGWYDDVDVLNRAALAANPRIQVYILPGQVGTYRIPSITSLSQTYTNIFGTPIAPQSGQFAAGVTTQETYEVAFVDLQERMFLAQSEAGIVEASGFSLDPEFMYSELIEIIELVAPYLEPYVTASQVAQVNAGLEAESIDAYFGLIDSLQQNSSMCLQADNGGFEYIAAIGLASGSADDLELGIATLDSSLNCDQAFLAETLFQTAFGNFRYQHARYDGELEGTEVGMVLFYTDLLAKLWAINFDYASPGDDIADFMSLPERRVSPIYKAEQAARSSTRLWFGYQHDGFLTANGGNTMLFGDVATRIYAASSDPLFPGAESEPNAQSAGFLGWWDNHYAEVAAYEPQYQRLNEIMKWSLVFAWMSNNETLSSATFLEDVEVKRDYWFPEWAANEDLKFEQWELIQFFEPGYRGLAVEALPILSTPMSLDGEFWVGGGWSGGVSLAEPFIFNDLRPLPPLFADDVLVQTLRSNVDFSVPFDTNQLTTLSGARYQFSALDNTARMEIIPPAQIRPRSVLTETVNTSMERLVVSDVTGLLVNVELGDVPVGQLAVRERLNGFDIGYESMSADRVRQLGLRLSVSNPVSWENAILEFPAVRDVVRLNSDSFAVRFSDEPRWFEFAIETPQIDLDPTAFMRVADLDAPSGVQITVIDADRTTVLRNGDLLIGSIDDRVPTAAREIPVLEHPLNDMVLAGDVEGIALRILDNPLEAVAVSDYRTKALQYVEALAANGDIQEALSFLQDLRVVFGDSPDIVILDALLSYENGAYQRIINTVNRKNGGDAPRLVLNDELIARIRAADNTADQLSIGRIVQASTGDVDGRLTLYVDTDAMNLSYAIDSLPAGTAVDVDAIPRDAVVYVADDFNFASVDPALSIREVLSLPSFGNDLRITQLTDSVVSAVRPGRLFIESEDLSFTRVKFDEAPSSGNRSGIQVGSGNSADADFDFVQGMIEDLLDEAMTGGGDECPDEQVEVDGHCECPPNTVLVANRCVAKSTIYLISAIK